VHLVAFIIRIYHDAWSPERQIRIECLICHPIQCRFTFRVNYKNSSTGHVPNRRDQRVQAMQYEVSEKSELQPYI